MPKRIMRASKDHNHDEIVKQFEQLGCTVEETICTGLEGFPDLMVGCTGVNHLVEIKNPSTAYGRRGLNPNQHEFNARWRGERMWTVRTRDEVVAIVQNWRRAGR